MFLRSLCSHPGCTKQKFLDQDYCVDHLAHREALIKQVINRLLNETCIKSENFAHLSLDGLSFEKKVFIACDFRNTCFKDTSFTSCHFSFCFFDRSSFDHFTLNNCKILESVFALSSFASCLFNGSEIMQNNFNASQFEQSQFLACDLMYSRFIGSHFHNVLFEDCNLKTVYLPKDQHPGFKYSNNEDAIYV